MYTAFIGDSFCQAYHHHSDWPHIVNRARKTEIAPYGFGGKSWWFSWSNFVYYYADKLDQVDAMVFCHTESNRINTNTPDNARLPNNFWVEHLSSEVQQAYKSYVTYFHDQQFNDWAQQRFFEHLAQNYSQIKMVHLHCFPHSVSWSNLLPGAVFSTPLQLLAIGGVSQTTLDRDPNYLNGDALRNHLTVENNQALAHTVIQALDNYSPGIREVDFTDFNLPNQYGMDQYLIHNDI